MIKVKKIKNKILALSLICILFLTSCSGNDPSLQVVMSSDNYEVTGGMYLAFMLEAFSNAQEKTKGEHKHIEGKTHSDEDKLDVLTSMVDGKQGRQWIIDETIKSSKLHFSVKREAVKRQLALTDEEKKASRLQAESQFEYFKDYYEENGIGEQSLVTLLENKKLYERIFDQIYGKGGEKEVSDADIQRYDDDNFDKISYITISNLEGNDQDVINKNKEIENLAKDLVKQINDGANFDESAKSTLKKSAEITGQPAPSDDQTVTNPVFIDKKNFSTVFNKEFTEQIEKTPMNKGNYKIKDNIVYIYKKIPKTDEDRHDRRETMLRLYKDDDLINELLDAYKGFYIDINQKAIDFYVPDKIKVM